MNHPHSALTLAAGAIADRNVQLRIFLLRLLDPDDLGYAVTPEVRREALQLLTQPHPPSHWQGDRL
jgi:hypothetical protein